MLAENFDLGLAVGALGGLRVPTEAQLNMVPGCVHYAIDMVVAPHDVLAHTEGVIHVHAAHGTGVDEVLARLLVLTQPPVHSAGCELAGLVGQCAGSEQLLDPSNWTQAPRSL